MAMGSLVLGIVGGELASWRGPAAIAIVEVALAMARMVAWTRKLADRQCAAERDKGDWRQCRGEGTTIPRKTHGNLDCVGHTRATMMPEFEIFSSSR
jgi:hypothetical protein